MDEAVATGYKALLDNLESLVFVLDVSDQTILFANAAFYSFMQADACIGMTLSDFIHQSEEKRERRNCFLQNVVGSFDPSKDVFCPKIGRWFKVDVNTITWGGKPAKSYFAKDVTEEKQETDWQREKEIAYDIFANKLSLVIWEYDKETHSVRMLQSFNEDYFREAGFGREVEDVPYSMVSMIDEKDVDKFIRLYTSIDAGVKHAEEKLMLAPVNSRDAGYVYIMLSTFTNYLGQEKVVGFGIDISSTQREEEKYRRLKKQLEDVMEISYESAMLDLVQNRCYDHKCMNDKVWKRHEAQTAEGFIYAVGMDIGDPKLQSEFFDRFSIEAMRLDFINGIQQLYMEFPTAETGLNMKWIRVTANLSLNPETNSVEALTYLMDISEEKKHTFIVKSLASESFHYIAFLYADTGEMEFFSNSTDIYYIKENTGLNNFNEDRRMRVENFILKEEDRKSYLEMTDIDTIRKELKEKKSYTVAFNQVVGGKESRLQVYFTWVAEEMEIMLVLCMDVTESYAKEQKYLKDLEKALFDAERAANSKMEFISRISHDIRTPLSAITSMTDFAFEDIDDKERLRNDLEKINSSNHFLMSLINDVLDVSKIDSGRIELVPEVYSFDDFFSDIKNMFLPLCGQKGVTFETVSDINIPAIRVDKVRFNQIVLNLISNAYKYTPTGGTITLTTIAKKIDGEKAKIDISVSDTGIGMGEDFQKKMFSPFSQDLENPERQKLKTGTGIGLYIVKKLIVLMRGTIDVKSALNEGTTMHVQMELPYADLSEITAGRSVPLSQRQKISGRVLIAEDNEINMEIALRTLHSMGLEADTAENGAIAVERFEACKPGTYICILMDIQMPVLSGYEATQAIRALNREDAKTIPIFALSANAYSEAVQQSKKVGMNGHISKPIDNDILYRALLEVSRGK